MGDIGAHNVRRLIIDDRSAVSETARSERCI